MDKVTDDPWAKEATDVQYETVTNPLTGQIVAKIEGASKSGELTLSLEEAAIALSSHVQMAVASSSKPNAHEIALLSTSIATLQQAFNGKSDAQNPSGAESSLVAKLRANMTH